MMNADEAWAAYAGIFMDDDETFRTNRALREAVEASAREVATKVFVYGVAEIERAKPIDKPHTVAPVSGEPGGVRVVDKRTGRESLAAVLLRLEVDRKELEDLIDLIASNPDTTAETVATRLGLTLSDGGTDG